jgi:MerR family copper efflux transcriptional regulator
MPASENHRRLALVSAGASVSAVTPDDEFVGEGLSASSELMQVGELAKATGKTVRAIHLYEDLGLLRPQDRSKGRYRLFSADAVVRVRWISKLQNLGFSLSEIQELVREQDGAGSAMGAAARLRAAYLEKLTEAQRKILELQQLEAELEHSLRYLNSCDTTCEPAVQVHSCPSCVRHPEDAPELVAGAHLATAYSS